MTNEQIDMAVHRVLGKCWHEWDKRSFPYYNTGESLEMYVCKKCFYRCFYPDTTRDNPPYTTDPRLYVPLLLECKAETYFHDPDNEDMLVQGYFGPDGACKWMEIKVPATVEGLGLGICKAFLIDRGIKIDDMLSNNTVMKIKGVEID